jgi:sugar phosphate permease
MEGGIVLCLFFLVGAYSDRIKPTIFLPVSFISRGLVLLALFLIKDPSTGYSYILWMLFALTHLMESVGVDGFYAKNVKNEIAGTMWGIMGITALVGQVISLEVAAKLYAYYAGYVFLFIGLCDLAMAGFLILMAYFGFLKPIENKELHTA